MSHSDDLDWLARNVHVWPGNARFAARPGMGDPLFYEHHYQHLVQFSRERVEAHRAELQNKPTWDQHVWPQIFQNEDGHWFGARDGWDFKAHIGKGWKGEGVSLLKEDGGYLSSGEILGDWRETMERRPELQSPVDMAMSIIGADRLEPAGVTKRLDWATQTVLAAVPGLMDEKYHFEPEFRPVSVSNETVQLEHPVVAAGSVGSKRDYGKPIIGAIPPHAELAVARVLTFGAEKYARDAWQAVENAEVRYMDAALRHLNAHRRGELADDESGESHLAHAACCILFMLDMQEREGIEND